MKKFITGALALVLGLGAFTLTSCAQKEKLYLLNWDEYINEDLLSQFEKENNCKVVMEVADSNETMYANISRGNQYDIVFPSDYMIAQMKHDDMIKELDFTKLSNYKYSDFNSTLTGLIDRDCADIKSYFVPYFWGSLGIMYNTDSLSEDSINTILSDGFDVMFNKTLTKKNGEAAAIGMYASSRDSIACALLALGKSLNTTDANDLALAEAKLSSMKGSYTAWATDDLKMGVASKKYDYALVYSGDFFDAVYSTLESNTALNFACYTPTDANNIFFDAMVIPSNCKNEELAYKFIDFMIDHDNSLENAQFVGYCPTIEAVYQDMLADPDFEDVVTLDAYSPADIVNGEIYQYLGAQIYDQYEAIYKRARGIK